MANPYNSNLVRGTGPTPAKIMIVGEGPGKDEDKYGRPFIGKSGKELTRYLFNEGINRDDCYVTNLVKYRMPGDADPTPDDVARDWPLLVTEFEKVQPQFVACVGRIATQYLIHEKLDMEWAHGMTFGCRMWNCPAMPIYHPAFGLYMPSATPLIADDFHKFAQMVKGRPSPMPKDFVGESTMYAELTDTFPPFLLDSIYIDTEGTVDKPWGLSYTQFPGQGFVIRASNTGMLKRFADTIHKLDLLVVMHNAMYDIGMLRVMGVEGFRFRDTMVNAHELCLLPQGLKPLARRLAGMEQRDYLDVIGDAGNKHAIQWLREAGEWRNKHYPEESKPQSKPKTLARGGGKLKRTSRTSVPK